METVLLDLAPSLLVLVSNLIYLSHRFVRLEQVIKDYGSRIERMERIQDSRSQRE